MINFTSSAKSMFDICPATCAKALKTHVFETFFDQYEGLIILNQSYFMLFIGVFSYIFKHQFLFMYKLLLFGLFFTCNVSFSQNNTIVEEERFIDSLNRVIENKASHDTVVANCLLLEVNYYYLENPDTAMILCKRAMVLSERIGFINGRSNSYGWLGYLLESHGDIEQSLEYSYKGLKLFEETGQKEQEAISLNNIGFIHYNQGNLDKALDFFYKSLAVKEEIENTHGVAMSLNNLASVYGDQGNLGKELEYLEKSMILYSELEDKQGQAMCLNNIAGVYNKQDNKVRALEYHQKSLDLRQETGDKQGIVISYHNIGRIYFETGRVKEAFDYGKRAMKIAQNIGFPDEIKDVAILLSEIFEKQDKGIEALEMHKLYILMRDSVENESNQRAVSEQQVKYQYDKKKAVDDAEREKQKAIEETKHEKRLAIEQEEKEKQRVISISIAIGLVLVLLFLLFVFNRLRVTRKQKEVIEHQKEEVESAHNELEEKNREIMDSINYAKRIQSAILPPSKLVKEYLRESFILYKPKDIVAGDFYWVEISTSLSPQNKKEGIEQSRSVLFAAADCTGHGVPGAMVSVICNNGLNRSVREYGLTDPGKILDKTREIVIAEFEKSEDEVKDGMDIALCSLEGNKLQYAGANNPLWIIRTSPDGRQDGELLETKADKQPIGKFDKQTPYTTHTFELEKGDSIYIFSDGYADQFGGDRGKKFKSKSFKELLLSIQDKPMNEQKEIIDNTFEVWKGDLEQIDDVCIIGVRI